MAIYLVKHPDSTFSGFLAGLDFSNGVASTNSLHDAQIAANAVGGKVEEFEIVKIKETDEIKAEQSTQVKSKKK